MSLSAIPTPPLNISRGGNSTTFLGSLLQCLTTLSGKKFFLISSVNFSWCNLRPFVHILLLGRRVHLALCSCQGAFLQADLPQLPQPFLIRLVFWILPQLCCSSLDVFPKGVSCHKGPNHWIQAPSLCIISPKVVILLGPWELVLFDWPSPVCMCYITRRNTFLSCILVISGITLGICSLFWGCTAKTRWSLRCERPSDQSLLKGNVECKLRAAWMVQMHPLSCSWNT